LRPDLNRCRTREFPHRRNDDPRERKPHGELMRKPPGAIDALVHRVMHWAALRVTGTM